MGGIDFGIARNQFALVRHDDQFDYYNGPGVDVTYMGAGEVDAQGAAVPETLYDGRGVVAQGGADLGYAVCAQQFYGALHERLTQKRYHGLGKFARDGLQTPALSAGHDNSFHVHIICGVRRNIVVKIDHI